MGRRLWRIGLPLIGWSCVYLAWFGYTGEHHGNWLLSIVTAPAAPHLWYLYSLIGLYAFLPVCAGFFQANPPRVQWFCLLFWLIGASLVPLEIALTERVSVGIGWAFLPLYAGYMAAGALLYHHLPALPRRIAPAWLAWVLLSLGTAVATWWRCHTLARPDEAFYVYSSPTVLLAALAAFVCLRWLFTRFVQPGGRPAAIIAFFSNVSFGVYLLHVLVLFYLDRKGYDYRFVNPWLGIPGLTLAIMLICVPVVRVLQKIPGLRLLVPA
jgi:surface polysaccharide O-acyltransferase-like enzyme